LPAQAQVAAWARLPRRLSEQAGPISHGWADFLKACCFGPKCKDKVFSFYFSRNNVNAILNVLV
jgi:hypothetical protein